MWLKIASSQIIPNPDMNQLIFVDLHISLHLFTDATIDNQSQYVENWCIMSQISNANYMMKYDKILHRAWQ